MMKSTGVLVLLAALVAASVVSASEARPPRHRVVFEATGEGPEAWEGVLNNVENVQAALGAKEVQVVVVAHGKGLGMLVAAGNPVADRLAALARSGVVFAACENTMRRKKVTKADLVPSATTVDSGVAEVVRRQEAGWSYVKAGG